MPPSSSATSRWSATPACGIRRRRSVTTSLRGLLYEEVIITCADRDLHSGLFGGGAANPIRVLARIIAGLHDENGRITMPGFYDGVKELPADIKAELKALNMTPEQFLGQVGLKVPAGEKDRMLIEQISTRPTCDVNGIIGGYTGEGAKTVIAAQAIGEDLVPPGRHAGPGEDPRVVPRLRARAAAGGRARRLHRITPAVRRSRSPTTIRRSARRARR